MPSRAEARSGIITGLDAGLKASSTHRPKRQQIPRFARDDKSEETAGPSTRTRSFRRVLAQEASRWLVDSGNNRPPATDVRS